MAVALKVSLRNEIDRLKKNIGQRSSGITSLRNELKKHEEIYNLLAGDRVEARRARRTGTRVKARRVRSGERVDWSSVLNGLPKSFTSSVVQEQAPNTKSKAYLRQVVVRWVKEGKVKRIERGKYRKI